MAAAGEERGRAKRAGEGLVAAGEPGPVPAAEGPGDRPGPSASRLPPPLPSRRGPPAGAAPTAPPPAAWQPAGPAAEPELLAQLPAWLVSLVLHMVGLLLLSLWVLQGDARPSLTLATSLSYEDEPGQLGEPLEALEPLEFEDPGILPEDEVQQIEPAGELDLAWETPLPAGPDLLGDLDSIPELTASLASGPPARMFAGRDPRVRAQLVRQEGGTAMTEAAAARGLEWLARHQNADGSWSLEAWHQAPRAVPVADGLGNRRNDVAATALALLPFLGAGQTHREGQYQDVVYKGLRWLLAQQREDGDLRGNWDVRGSDISRMYAHAQAALVLCEAFALTGDRELRQPAQSALDFIVRAQHRQGGWRYAPGQAGDTSVFGWQVMALRSGKMVYLEVPERTFQQASRYLNRAQTDRYGGHYGYQPGDRATPAMTAEALLCRQYLGWPREHPGLRGGVETLLKNLPDPASPNIYYWYYATQVMHQYGGQPWRRWNARMRAVLVDMQRKHGPLAGSWDPRGGHASSGGRIYMTSLAVCTLEVYYRHMPLYRDYVIDVDEPEAEAGPRAARREGPSGP